MCQKKIVNNSPENFDFGNLPPRVVSEIYEIELTLEEVMECLRNRPPVYVSVKEGRFCFELNIDISVKKGLAWVTGITSFIWAFLELTFDYIPSLLGWLN